MQPKQITTGCFALSAIFFLGIIGSYFYFSQPDFEDEHVVIHFKTTPLPGIVTVYLKDRQGNSIADAAIQVKDIDWRGTSKVTDDEGFVSYRHGEKNIYGLKINGKILFEQKEAITLKEYGIRFYVNFK